MEVKKKFATNKISSKPPVPYIYRNYWNRKLLQFVSQLVNGTKTNQFPFSTLFKLRSIFYIKITFLGCSISVSIDHIILDFPMILVVSYTCAITLSLMYNGLLQIHPTQKLWIISEMRSVRVSQCAPKLSQGAPSLSQWGCPESVLRCPHFFRHILSLQHLALANCRL